MIYGGVEQTLVLLGDDLTDSQKETVKKLLGVEDFKEDISLTEDDVDILIENNLLNQDAIEVYIEEDYNDIVFVGE